MVMHKLVVFAIFFGSPYILFLCALPDCPLLRNRYATDCALDQGLTLVHMVYDRSAISDAFCIGAFPMDLRLSGDGFFIGRDLN
jgi:hypothetical protein